MTPASIAEAGAMLRAGEISAVELLAEYLRVVDEWEPVINAFITLCRDEAHAAARAADALFAAGYDLGPLQGLPIALKDNIDTANVRTTVGSRLFAQNVPDVDATVVRLLKRAGSVLIGKTNLHEFTLGATTVNPFYGTTRNPWDPQRTVAGSSGGSAAAVAAGQCLAALGSDTSGSIRMPAAMTGISGLRPTHGLVDATGVFPLSLTADAVGPMARSVDDLELILDCIAPNRTHTPRRPDLHGIRIGVMRKLALTRLEAGLAEVFATALADLETLGARVVDLPVPRSFERIPQWRKMRFAETAVIHREYLEAQPESYSDDVRTAIEPGLRISAVEYLQAADARAAITNDLMTSFEEVDLIATPTVPFVATVIGQESVDLQGEHEDFLPALLRFATLASCIGAPALSAPCGVLRGLPVGLQLMARPYAEPLLLDVGRAYEAINSWHLRTPVSPS